MAMVSQAPLAIKLSLIIAVAAVTIGASPSLLADERVAGLDVTPKEASGWKLPRQLSEISGLAVTDDGRLLAHGDENGIVYELDPHAGKIVKSFALGEVTERADFEGIASVGDMVYLVTSDGTIYEAPEGADGERVLFNSYGTGAGRQCEVEGLAYEKSSGALLLVCKSARIKELTGHIAIFRWNIDTRMLAQSPVLLVALESIDAESPVHTLHPSGIEVLPGSGNYLLVAAQERIIVEITPGGALVSARRLLPDLHVQPEGVAMLASGTLVIADEAGRGRRSGQGRLTLYESQKADRE